MSALGDEMRKLRKKSRKSVREVAKLLDISAPYLSDLELGRRRWSEEMIAAFKHVLK